MNTMINLIKSEEGATAIEYGLIATLVAIAAIAAMKFLGTSLSTAFSRASSGLNR